MNKVNLRRKILVRFLKENNCCKQFFHYFYTSNDWNYIFKNKLKNINNLVNIAIKQKYESYNEISLAFIWGKSNEGYDYWEKLFEKWKKIIKQL